MPRDLRSDATYLCDMLLACRRRRRFTESVTPDRFLQDDLVQAGVQRQIEIIGEAARRVSDGLRERYPAVPWRQVIAQRNVMAHDYNGIDDFRIWQVAQTHIPALEAQLAAMLDELGHTRVEEERPPTAQG